MEEKVGHNDVDTKCGKLHSLICFLLRNLYSSASNNVPSARVQLGGPLVEDGEQRLTVFFLWCELKFEFGSAGPSSVAGAWSNEHLDR